MADSSARLSPPAAADDRVIDSFRRSARAILYEVSRVIVGQEDVLRGTLIALLAPGHVLLEGVPGLGKTRLVRALAEALDLRYSRIQFTPDLMPADITGTNIISEDADSRERRFRFEPGPVFAHLILADEINRATPKTQSALLEAMAEQQVTIGRERHPLASPFMVLATQNPIEMEGTYPLPEAQLDRFFFKLNVTYPDADELVEILTRTTGENVPEARQVATDEDILQMQALARQVPVAQHVKEYAARLVMSTHPEEPSAPKVTRDYVRFGASVRGAQALVSAGKIHALLDGRYNVAYDDVRAVAHAALRHRIILNFEAEAEGVSTDYIVDQIVISVTPEEARL